jgi:hypothetical protein
MKIEGSHNIAAPPDRVFASLVDPTVLQQAIPGCEKMEQTGEDDYHAHLKLGLASIKGSYVGKVRLTDKAPPHKFTLHLEGKGGPGFVKGTTAIELKPEGQGTKLQFSADVQVGGLIASVGSRVIEAAAKKLAGEFFQKFAKLVEKPAAPAAGA